MILLVNPRATSPKNRRFPLSVLAIAAVLDGREPYSIVDGNAGDLAGADWAGAEPPEALAVTVMPGPQTRAAIPLCHVFRRRFPRVPILWGGYFPSLYPDTVLNSSIVDFVVRGQGEDTFLEWLEAWRGGGDFSRIRGLSYKDAAGRAVHNPPRPMRSPADYPWFPYHRLDASRYIARTFLGSRTTVHQASLGCPYRCNFCGVVGVFNREKVEPPERTAAILDHQQRAYGINAVQFYDNNFFLREDHARELADRLSPLNLHWWCESRIDAMLRFSDATLRRLKHSGLTMVFFGAESGSDEQLRQMDKRLTSAQVLELARRLRQIGIIPEYSFIFGNPAAPERDTRETIAFIRKVKAVNPDVEIIVQTYVPTPQPGAVYGNVAEAVGFPTRLDDWARDDSSRLASRIDPRLPWLPRRVQRRIHDFDTVLRARWPTVQDAFLPAWGRLLLQAAGSWRYAFGVYSRPAELAWLQRRLRLRQPRYESL